MITSDIENLCFGLFSQINPMANTWNIAKIYSNHSEYWYLLLSIQA